MQGLATLSAVGDRAILKSRTLGLFCSIKCPGNLILKTYDLAKSLRDKGITVISGAPMDSPESLVQQYLMNTLVTGENVCDH